MKTNQQITLFRWPKSLIFNSSVVLSPQSKTPLFALQHHNETKCKKGRSTPPQSTRLEADHTQQAHKIWCGAAPLQQPSKRTPRAAIARGSRPPSSPPSLGPGLRCRERRALRGKGRSGDTGFRILPLTGQELWGARLITCSFTLLVLAETLRAVSS